MVLLCEAAHKEHKDRKRGRLDTLGIFAIYELFAAITIRTMPIIKW